jgi:hypothetical protein
MAEQRLKAVHYAFRVKRPQYRAACNAWLRLIDTGWSFTKDPAKTTCKRCLKVLRAL